MTRQRTLSALFLGGALAVAVGASALAPGRAQALPVPQDCGEGGPVICDGTTDWTGFQLITYYHYRTADPGEPLSPFRPAPEP